MAIFTISGILGILGAAVTAVASGAGFLANIATIPFALAGNNRTLALVMYWIIFAIDAFIIVRITSAVLQPFYDIFGIEGVELGFTSIYLMVINIFTGFIFGWFFVPFHLFLIVTIILV
ncbi:hypothetical protein LCGC14_0700280, partial [marine sediment metagenome]